MRQDDRGLETAEATVTAANAIAPFHKTQVTPRWVKI